MNYVFKFSDGKTLSFYADRDEELALRYIDEILIDLGLIELRRERIDMDDTYIIHLKGTSSTALLKQMHNEMQQVPAYP